MLTPEEHHQKELIDSLRADIRGLTRALDEHTQAFKSTESSHDAGRQQAEEARIRAVVLEEIQAERQATEAKGKKKKWSSFEKWYFAVQFLLLIATSLAFAAAYWYASIADIQKNTMISQQTTAATTLAEIQKQTPGVLGSAGAAQKQIGLLQRQFRMEQRPYVTVDVKDSTAVKGQPVVISINYRNVGRSRALNIHVHRHILLGDAINTIKREGRDRDVGSSLDAGAPPSYVTTVSVKDPYANEGLSYPKDEWINWNGTDQILVFGRATYEDALGGMYCTPIFLTRLDSGAWAFIQALTFGFTANDMCPAGTDSR